MNVLLSLLIVILVLGLVWWVITQLPLAPPWRMAATVVFAVIAILVLLSFLPGMPRVIS